jgi:hypothetical protein
VGGVYAWPRRAQSHNDRAQQLVRVAFSVALLNASKLATRWQDALIHAGLVGSQNFNLRSKTQISHAPYLGNSTSARGGLPHEVRRHRARLRRADKPAKRRRPE